MSIRVSTQVLHSQNRNKLKHGSCEASPNQANLRGSAQRFWQHRRHAQAGSSARSCDHSERCGSVHGDRQNSTPICFHRRARGAQCLSPRLLSETDLASCAPKKVRTTSQVNAETTTSAKVSRSTEVANTAGAYRPVQAA